VRGVCECEGYVRLRGVWGGLFRSIGKARDGCVVRCWLSESLLSPC
jgi:hypothetical protein